MSKPLFNFYIALCDHLCEDKRVLKLHPASLFDHQGFYYLYFPFTLSNLLNHSFYITEVSLMLSFMFPAFGGIRYWPNTVILLNIVSTEIFLLIYLLSPEFFTYLERLTGVIFQGFWNVSVGHFSSFITLGNFYILSLNIFSVPLVECHAMYTNYHGLGHLFLPRISYSLYLI